LPFFIIGLLPLIFQYTPLPDLFGLQTDYTFSQLGLGFFGEIKFLILKNLEKVLSDLLVLGRCFFSLFYSIGIGVVFFNGFKIN